MRLQDLGIVFQQQFSNSLATFELSWINSFLRFWRFELLKNGKKNVASPWNPKIGAPLLYSLVNFRNRGWSCAYFITHVCWYCYVYYWVGKSCERSVYAGCILLYLWKSKMNMVPKDIRARQKHIYIYICIFPALWYSACTLCLCLLEIIHSFGGEVIDVWHFSQEYIRNASTYFCLEILFRFWRF